MMAIARKRHNIVFVVNIDSPKRNQVKTGNTINPVLDPTNLAVHADAVSEATSFQAYQKR